MILNDYIAHFDRIFGTNLLSEIENKTFPMLNYAFDELVEDLYTQNSGSKEISKQKGMIADKIETLNSTEQKKLLDEYAELESELRVDIDKQMLTFGFLICFEQLREMQAIR